MYNQCTNIAIYWIYAICHRTLKTQINVQKRVSYDIAYDAPFCEHTIAYVKQLTLIFTPKVKRLRMIFCATLPHLSFNLWLVKIKFLKNDLSQNI